MGCLKTQTGKHNFERQEDTPEGDWIFICSLCGERKMIETIPVMMDDAGNPKMIFEQGEWHQLRGRMHGKKAAK